MFPVETEWPSLQVQHREALSPIKVPDVRLASSLDPIPTQQTISSEVIVPGLQRLVSAHSRDANARTIEPVTLATPTSSVWEQSAIQCGPTPWFAMETGRLHWMLANACLKFGEDFLRVLSAAWCFGRARRARFHDLCAVVHSSVASWKSSFPEGTPNVVARLCEFLSKEGLEKVLQSWAKQAVESDSHESLFGVACLLQLDGQDDQSREYFRVLAAGRARVCFKLSQPIFFLSSCNLVGELPKRVQAHIVPMVSHPAGW